MITLTALIRCRPGSEARIRAALMDVARIANTEEPGTVAYHVTEADDGVFVTYERYRDEAAMEAHNAGAGATAFFAVAEGHLEKVDIVTGREI